MRRAGTSYFGNRILRHVRADMDGLASRGFTGVLHTFSENDLRYYRGTLASIVAASHDAGLHVQMNPWGAGGVFGGEAESFFTAAHPETGQIFDDGRRIGAACLNRPEFRAFMRSWAQAAVETGADSIFWDEPHWVDPQHFGAPAERWACVCEVCRSRFRHEMGDDMPTVMTETVAAFRERCLADFLEEMMAEVRRLGGKNTICLLPATEGPQGISDWSRIASLEGLDTLATDPYWKAFGVAAEPFVSKFSHLVRSLSDDHGVDAQIWIQGFRVNGEDADDIRAAVASARAAGVEDLWVWGYEACAHMDALAPDHPHEVWEVLCDALVGETT